MKLHPVVALVLGGLMGIMVALKIIVSMDVAGDGRQVLIVLACVLFFCLLSMFWINWGRRK